MIPKIIHYVWFGGKPLDRLSKKCLKSWKKYCPDYQIIRWDEKNFDIEMFDYTSEAFREKKWAFLSDVVRLFALVSLGGIYMDTDVELVAPLDNYLDKRAFSGFGDLTTIPTGLMACEKGYALFKNFLKDYKNRHFVNKDGSFDLTTNAEKITDYCKKFGFLPNNQYQNIEGFEIYPFDYFCAKDYSTLKLKRTKNTISIHHFAGSWVSKKYKFTRFIGPKATKFLVKIKHIFIKKNEK